MTVLAALGIVAFAVPEAASAGTTFFRSQGCGVKYRAEKVSTYSTAKTPSYRAAVRRWRFEDLGGRILHPPTSWEARKSKSLTSKIHQMKYLDRLFAVADERRLPSTKPMSSADRRLALRRAVELAVDWSRAANRGKVPKNVAWNPRVAAIRAPYLAYAARRGACAGILSNREAKEVQRALDRHVPVLRRRPKESTPANHKLSIYSGAAMLASYFPGDRQLRSVAENAGRKFVASIAGGYQTAEGVWLEHSPRYQRLAYEVLDGWLENVDPQAGAVRRVRDRLLSTLGWLVMPDNRLVTFGDTSGELIEDGTILGARHHGWWVAQRSGYAVHSAPSNWFGITAQYHTRQHKQADELSFDLFAGGERLIQDPGFYSKDRGSMFNYQERAGAHSTLTVDGRDFEVKLHQPYGSAIKASGAGDGWYAVRATNPLLVAPRRLTAAQRRHSNQFKREVRRKLREARRYDARHTRTYLYKPGEALIVADAVRSDGVHTYRRHFQLAPNVAVTTKLVDGLSFESGKLAGRIVTDSAGMPADLSIDRNSLVFPFGETRRNRATLSYTSRVKKLDEATAFFYGPSQVRSIAVHGGLADGVRIELRGLLGTRTGTLTVTRSGRSLSVSESR